SKGSFLIVDLAVCCLAILKYLCFVLGENLLCELSVILGSWARRCVRRDGLTHRRALGELDVFPDDGFVGELREPRPELLDHLRRVVRPLVHSAGKDTRNGGVRV